MNQYDGRFFREFVQKRNYDLSPKYDSHRKIKKAHAYFGKKIDEKIEDQSDKCAAITELLEAVLERFTFVYVVSAPIDSYQVFRVLNDRGRNLSQLDLFRTFLLDKVSSQRRDEFAEDWSQILDIQSPGSPLDLLRFFWISKFGDVKAMRLARDIDRRIKGNEITADEIADELFFYSDIYKRLISPGAGFKQAQIDQLNAVQAFRAKALMPLLMKSLYLQDSSGSFSMKDFNSILSLGLACYVRHTIIGERDNSKLESVLYKAAKTLTANRVSQVLSDIRDFVKEKGLTDEVFEEEFAKASIENDAYAKALLRGIETHSYNHAERSLPSTSELHLEHIYPKNPRQDFKLAVHSDVVSRIGNLTLVADRINQRASNKPFADKRAHLSESQIVMTSALGELPQWGVTEIDERQAKLAKTAVEVWSI